MTTLKFVQPRGRETSQLTDVKRALIPAMAICPECFEPDKHIGFHLY